MDKTTEALDLNNLRAVANVERRIPAIWEDSNADWGDAVGGPGAHEIFAGRIISALLSELRASIAAPAGQQAEPVAYLIRERIGGYGWSEWKPCTRDEGEARKRHADIFEVRPLVDAAPVSAAPATPSGELNYTAAEVVRAHAQGYELGMKQKREALAAPAAAAQPSEQDAELAKEAAKLAPILRNMCEGGDVHGDGVDIYADDYMAGDGDTYVVRAAVLLEKIAAATPEQSETTMEKANG